MQQGNSEIQLFNESGQEIPVNLSAVQDLTSLLEEHEACRFSLLEVAYVDEDEIIRINKEHLERNYVTDIITFRYDENERNTGIEGTIFCCAPRIYEQALEYNQDAETEFKRILIHGLLHLCGYKDHTSDKKEEMTQKENFYLSKLF